MPAFHMGAGDPNSVPCVCTENTELSPLMFWDKVSHGTWRLSILLDWLVNELKESSCLVASHPQQQITDVCGHPWLLVFAEYSGPHACLHIGTLLPKPLPQFTDSHIYWKLIFISTKCSLGTLSHPSPESFVDDRDDSVGRVFALKAQRVESSDPT